VAGRYDYLQNQSTASVSGIVSMTLYATVLTTGRTGAPVHVANLSATAPIYIQLARSPGSSNYSTDMGQVPRWWSVDMENLSPLVRWPRREWPYHMIMHAFS
jgi:hypothetical protein